MNAQKTYNEFIQIKKALAQSNQLMSTEQLNESIGYTETAIIYQLQIEIGFPKGHDDSFNIILDCIDDEVEFSEMLDMLGEVKR